MFHIQSRLAERAGAAPAVLALLALALSVPFATRAQDAGADGLEHTVVAGDTLEALARNYLDDARQWPALQQANRIADPRRLQPGSRILIPNALLPTRPARVQFTHGQVQATLPGTQAPHTPAADQALPEGTRLQTGSDGFISIRLFDGSTVRVQADTELRLSRLRKQARPGSAQSVIELQRGVIEPSVPAARDGSRRLDIRTPSATASVRGTRFSVGAEEDARTLTAVTEGTVAVQGSVGATALVPHGQGLAVAANGQAGSPQALLPAPDPTHWPASVHDADFLRLHLPPVPGASAYEVQLARDADLTQVLRAATSRSSDATLPAVEDGDYQLALRAIDVQGLPGQRTVRPLRVKAHPIPPLYAAPASGAILAAGKLRLVCTGVAEAGRYRLQLASGGDFGQPLLDTSTDGACEATTPALPPGRYQWRVASLRRLADGHWDQGPFAAAQGFSAVAPPQAPATVEVRGATHLFWPAQPGQRFELQAAANADFSPLLVDATLDRPEWSAAALPPGRIWVRIRTLDTSGLTSAFSTPHLLTIPARIQAGDGLPVTSGDGQSLQRP